MNNLQKCSAPDTSRKCMWRQREDSFDPPFIIRTENQDGSSVCSRRLGKKFVLEKSKPIRSCVLGSTSHRNLRALPPRSALGCASGTALGQRAQVSMLGRTSDAASNINLVTDSFCITVIWGLWYRAVRDRPQGLLHVLIMPIRTDFPALRGGTVPLSARYGRC